MISYSLFLIQLLIISPNKESCFLRIPKRYVIPQLIRLVAHSAGWRVVKSKERILVPASWGTGADLEDAALCRYLDGTEAMVKRKILSSRSTSSSHSHTTNHLASRQALGHDQVDGGNS